MKDEETCEEFVNRTSRFPETDMWKAWIGQVHMYANQRPVNGKVSCLLACKQRVVGMAEDFEWDHRGRATDIVGYWPHAEIPE